MAINGNKIGMLDGKEAAVTADPAGVNHLAVSDGPNRNVGRDIAKFNVNTGMVAGKSFGLDGRISGSNIDTEKFFSDPLLKFPNGLG